MVPFTGCRNSSNGSANRVSTVAAGRSIFTPSPSLITFPGRITGIPELEAQGLISPLVRSWLTMVQLPSLGSNTFPLPCYTKNRIRSIFIKGIVKIKMAENAFFDGCLPGLLHNRWHHQSSPAAEPTGAERYRLTENLWDPAGQSPMNSTGGGTNAFSPSDVGLVCIPEITPSISTRHQNTPLKTDVEIFGCFNFHALLVYPILRKVRFH